MKAVILDANAIARTDWVLATAAWRVLSYRARNRRILLVVPEVVIREVVGAYRRALVDTLHKADRQLGLLRSMGVHDAMTPRVDVDQAVSEYGQLIRDRIAEARGATPDPPEVHLLDLADRAIGRIRPFDEHGSGFRDSIVWEQTVAVLTDRRVSSVTLISNDKKAFHAVKEPMALHPELGADLERRGQLATDVRVSESMSAYLRATGTRDEEIEATVADLLEDQRATIETNISYALSDIGSVDTGSMFVDATVEGVSGPMTIELLGVYPIRGDDFGAEDPVYVEMEVEADFDLEVEDLTEGHHRSSQSHTGLTVVSATFDPVSATMDGFAASGLSIDAEDLIERVGW